MIDPPFVIVGGGLAAATIAKTLRQEGFDGGIVLLSAESHLPYDRPPLSKAVLLGMHGADGPPHLTAEEIATDKIDCRLGSEVSAIDRRSKTLILADDRRVSYGTLFLATGGSPHQIPGVAKLSSRIHVLRTREDGYKLRQVLQANTPVTVVGGGWIGLEVAASARSLGNPVTLLASGDALCARSVPGVVSDWLEGLHRAHGVDLRYRARVLSIDNGAADVQLRLANGSRLGADQVVIGIGIVPNDRLALACGLQTDNGIIVDVNGRTSDPVIFAAGDVARRPCNLTGAMLRHETWSEAISGGTRCARAALGRPAAVPSWPWFWSDQYGTNLQVLGLPHLGSATIVRSNPAGGSGSWMATRDDGAVVGFVSVNSGRDISAVRRLIEGNRLPSLAEWSDHQCRIV